MTLRATILISVYNAAPYLQQCIDSILQQSYSEFDCWIIDDGSTDGSREILMQQTDPRIKIYFNVTNLGIANSLNQYLTKINTEYIFRMDADDICMPYRMEKQIAFMDAYPEIGMSGGALEYFGKKNETWYPATQHEEIISRLLFNSAIPNPTLVIRTAILQQHQLIYNTQFTKPPMEDYALLIDCIKKVKFGNLKEVLVMHREHDQNQSLVFRDSKQEAMIRIYEMLFTQLNIEASKQDLLIHYQLAYNIPDFKNHSLTTYIRWCKYLMNQMDNKQELKNVIYIYLFKFFKHLIHKPIHSFQLLFFLFRIKFI